MMLEQVQGQTLGLFARFHAFVVSGLALFAVNVEVLRLEDLELVIDCYFLID